MLLGEHRLDACECLALEIVCAAQDHVRNEILRIPCRACRAGEHRSTYIRIPVEDVNGQAVGGGGPLDVDQEVAAAVVEEGGVERGRKPGTRCQSGEGVGRPAEDQCLGAGYVVAVELRLEDVTGGVTHVDLEVSVGTVIHAHRSALPEKIIDRYRGPYLAVQHYHLVAYAAGISTAAERGAARPLVKTYLDVRKCCGAQKQQGFEKPIHHPSFPCRVVVLTIIARQVFPKEELDVPEPSPI